MLAVDSGGEKNREKEVKIPAVYINSNAKHRSFLLFATFVYRHAHLALRSTPTLFMVSFIRIKVCFIWKKVVVLLPIYGSEEQKT